MIRESRNDIREEVKDFYHRMNFNLEFERGDWCVMVPRIGYCCASKRQTDLTIDFSFVYDMKQLDRSCATSTILSRITRAILKRSYGRRRKLLTINTCMTSSDFNAAKPRTKKEYPYKISSFWTNISISSSLFWSSFISASQIIGLCNIIAHSKLSLARKSALMATSAQFIIQSDVLSRLRYGSLFKNMIRANLTGVVENRLGMHIYTPSR